MSFEENIFVKFRCRKQVELTRLKIAIDPFFTEWKVSKYGVSSGPYFPLYGLNAETYAVNLFSPNSGKYGPVKTPYLDTFHAVSLQLRNVKKAEFSRYFRYV